jgi:hypothetical protein
MPEEVFMENRMQTEPLPSGGSGNAQPIAHATSTVTDGDLLSMSNLALAPTNPTQAAPSPPPNGRSRSQMSNRQTAPTNDVAVVTSNQKTGPVGDNTKDSKNTFVATPTETNQKAVAGGTVGNKNSKPA